MGGGGDILHGFVRSRAKDPTNYINRTRKSSRVTTRCNLPSLNPAAIIPFVIVPRYVAANAGASFDTEIFREYFRKITRALVGRSGFRTRLCRIIRGECVCHGRRRRGYGGYGRCRVSPWVIFPVIRNTRLLSHSTYRT